MYTTNNVIVFLNDEEFYNWSVDPKLKVVEGKSCSFTTWDFSYEYQKALEEGKQFSIYDDKNSRLMKNEEISYRTITRKVENLIPYNRIHKK